MPPALRHSGPELNWTEIDYCTNIADSKIITSVNGDLDGRREIVWVNDFFFLFFFFLKLELIEFFKFVTSRNNTSQKNTSQQTTSKRRTARPGVKSSVNETIGYRKKRGFIWMARGVKRYAFFRPNECDRTATLI